MELYYEKNVTNEKMRENPTKTKILLIIKYICIGLLIFGGIILFLATISNGTDLLTNLTKLSFVYVLLIVPCAGGIWMTSKYIKERNCEYDYIIISNTLRIVRIINDKKRTSIIYTDLINVEKVGFTDSEDFKNKYLTNESLQKVTAFCNLQDRYMYIVCGNDGKRCLVLCEIDEGMINALKKTISVYGILADEILKYGK